MSLPNELHPLQLGAGSAAAYEIEQSLRFNQADSNTLTRTPSSSGNLRTGTISFWIKKSFLQSVGSPATQMSLLGCQGNGFFLFRYRYLTDRLSYGQGHAGNTGGFETLAEYRDPGAWQHICLVNDFTNATAADMARLYINGVRQDVNITSAYTNADGSWNSANLHYIGYQSSYFEGYMAEFHNVDGTALDPDQFGEYDDNGVWRPIAYTGSYGTNGFYLKFDPSATNGVGHDHSGNGNHWTANNFTTSGTGTDVMSDTPTTNWCTLNPLDSGEFGAGITLSEGNLKTVSTSSDRHVRSTFFLPTSGKWYWEMTATTVNTAGYLGTGLYHATGSLTASAAATAQGRWYLADGYGNGGSWGATYDDGDIIGIAVDMDSGKIWAAKNNTWQASGDPVAGTNPMYDDLLTAYSDIAWSPVCANFQSGNTADFNFGQRAFAYTPPTGFKALNTRTLPALTVKDGSQNMMPVLWTGTGSARTQGGYNFQPDLLWIMNRSNSGMNVRLHDVVRGDNGTVMYRLGTNQQNNEDTDTSVTGLTSTGFTIGNNATDHPNVSGHSYVGWGWKAAQNSGSSIAAGSIDGTNPTIASTVSANPSAGFSIVTWNGSTANGTVGHGLGVAPSLIIFKRRNATTSWPVYHSSISPSNVVYLNETAAQASSGNSFSSTPTAPTSTVFSVGDKGDTNYGTMVAYCFAEVEGYSKFGRYTGNGNADGPFIYCGFRPAWIMYKITNTTGNWIIHDTTRSEYNVTTNRLFANLTNAENTSTTVSWDLLSNGAKIRTSDAGVNGSGNTFIFAAFSEHPFGGSGVSPATAR